MHDASLTPGPLGTIVLVDVATRIGVFVDVAPGIGVSVIVEVGSGVCVNVIVEPGGTVSVGVGVSVSTAVIAVGDTCLLHPNAAIISISIDVINKPFFI